MKPKKKPTPPPAPRNNIKANQESNAKRKQKNPFTCARGADWG